MLSKVKLDTCKCVIGLFYLQIFLDKNPFPITELNNLTMTYYCSTLSVRFWAEITSMKIGLLLRQRLERKERWLMVLNGLANMWQNNSSKTHMKAGEWLNLAMAGTGRRPRMVCLLVTSTIIAVSVEAKSKTLKTTSTLKQLYSVGGAEFEGASLAYSVEAMSFLLIWEGSKDNNLYASIGLCLCLCLHLFVCVCIYRGAKSRRIE